MALDPTGNAKLGTEPTAALHVTPVGATHDPSLQAPAAPPGLDRINSTMMETMPLSLAPQPDMTAAGHGAMPGDSRMMAGMGGTTQTPALPDAHIGPIAANSAVPTLKVSPTSHHHKRHHHHNHSAAWYRAHHQKVPHHLHPLHHHKMKADTAKHPHDAAPLMAGDTYAAPAGATGQQPVAPTQASAPLQQAPAASVAAKPAAVQMADATSKPLPNRLALRGPGASH